ncbi:outer membrane beta-barrel protein [Algoriphagus terrigena]|uniref:outer membrane beta-barrel protein n=1 Tax=Algoriphagus terrigena TaxID=344884 RepID=UPI00047C83E0|nr:hypothetical protein [Algoriphagus terrigena]
MYFTSCRRLGFLAILFLVVFSNSAHSQHSKSDLIGVTVLGELVSYNDFYPSVGFVFERSFTKRSGMEIGTYYRAERTDIYINVTFEDGNQIFDEFSVRESYLTFPVLYRFYTKAVTLSVGPFVEAFVGWDQISPGTGEVTSYEISPAVSLRPLLKVSKPFSIGKNLSLEPELRFGISARSSQAFYGIGLQFKQQMLSKTE